MKNKILQLNSTKSEQVFIDVTTRKNNLIKTEKYCENQNGKTPKRGFNELRNISISKKLSLDKQCPSGIQNGEKSKINNQKCKFDLTETQSQCNINKISKLRHKLEDLYQHYRQQQSSIQQMETKINQVGQLNRENANLTLEIIKFRNMVKDVLLEREKQKLSKQYL